MKTTFLLVTVAAILGATQNSLAGDAAATPSKNLAFLASPRALEEFPWLARKAPATTTSPALTETAISVTMKNRALAACPRVLEQFPELNRVRREGDSSKPGTGMSQLDEVTRNRALTASPRTLEAFPQLARRVASPLADKSVQIAPLK